MVAAMKLPAHTAQPPNNCCCCCMLIYYWRPVVGRTGGGKEGRRRKPEDSDDQMQFINDCDDRNVIEMLWPLVDDCGGLVLTFYTSLCSRTPTVI